MCDYSEEVQRLWSRLWSSVHLVASLLRSVWSSLLTKTSVMMLWVKLIHITVKLIEVISSRIMTASLHPNMLYHWTFVKGRAHVLCIYMNIWCMYVSCKNPTLTVIDCVDVIKCKQSISEPHLPEKGRPGYILKFFFLIILWTAMDLRMHHVTPSVLGELYEPLNCLCTYSQD